MVDLTHLRDQKLKLIPFFAWQCLTIECENRDYDLVITNDNHMKNLLKFLTY